MTTTTKDAEIARRSWHDLWDRCPRPRSRLEESEEIIKSLLHNMSAPPKSVVSFQGLGEPDGDEPLSPARTGRSLFGSPVRFALPGTWRGLSLRELMREIDPACRSRTREHLETRLRRRLDERTDELWLPDGCLTIPAEDDHPAPWPDDVAALAVLSRCTDTVWLRDKEPSWQAAIELGSVSLLVPPAFVDALPAPVRNRRGTDDRRRAP